MQVMGERVGSALKNLRLTIRIGLTGMQINILHHRYLLITSVEEFHIFPLIHTNDGIFLLVGKNRPKL